MYSFLHRIDIAISHVETDATSSKPNSSTDTASWKKEVYDTSLDRVEMNKIVMDYLVTEGFKEAAEKFQLESGVHTNTSIDQMDMRINVRDAIQNGDVNKAIDITNTLNSEILENHPPIYFHLQQQKLIELIREHDIDGALEFSQKVLAELATENNEYLDDLEKTMALLAYDEPANSPFSDLLNLVQRQKVASELNSAILEADHREKIPKLAGMLKLLLWCQSELDKKHVKYPKLTDFVNSTLKHSNEPRKTSLAIT